MGIVYQLDKRSGITYAYESISRWDPEKRQSRAKRTLIGRLDTTTGEIVPTDGRVKKAMARKAQTPDYEALWREACAERDALAEEVRRLKLALGGGRA